LVGRSYHPAAPMKLKLQASDADLVVSVGILGLSH